MIRDDHRKPLAHYGAPQGRARSRLAPPSYTTSRDATLRWDKQRYLTGRYRHHLVRADEDFKISLQRVDLLNYDAPLDYVLQSWV